MRSFKCLFLIAIASLILLNACDTKEEQIPSNEPIEISSLAITSIKYEIGRDGGNFEVQVKANVEFEVTISVDWITRNDTKASTSTKLFFSVAKNETYDNREGTITIKEKNGVLSNTIKVYQSQEDAIILTKKSYDLSSESHTLEVEVKTNVDFEVLIPEAAKSWVTYTGTKAIRTGTLLFDIAENDTYEARSTELYVKNKASKIQDTLTIYQKSNLGLLVTPSEFNLSYEATTIEVDVQTNVEYGVIISDDWITEITTKGLSSIIRSFSISKNETFGNREGTIMIKQKNGTLSSTIKINQSQEDVIILSNKSFELSSDSHTLEIEVKTNVDFEVIIPEVANSWVSYTGTKALRTEILLLNIAANDSDATRSTELYVKNKANNLQDTLTIKQDGNELGVYRVTKMGTLGTLLNQTQKDTITKMIVRGEINKADFEVMKSQMPQLRYVDLKDVECENDEIPAEAFGDWEYTKANKIITTIIFPTSINTIGYQAFYQCKGLTGSLNLPDGLTTIREKAFAGCDGIIGPLALPDGLKTISQFAFAGCANFTGSLTLPAGLKTIGQAAFSGCIGFKGSLILPDSLTTLDSDAFYYCQGFTGSLTLPDGLTTIGNEAFRMCTGFNGLLKLPAGLATIGDYAFEGCRGLTGSLVLPDGVTTIGGNAFWGCLSFTGTLTIPDGVTTIGGGAFGYCSGISGLVLGNNITTIYEAAFKKCINILGNVVFPIGLVSIRSEAFTDCDKVKAFRFPHTTPPQYFSNMFPAGATVEVPNAAVDTYKATAGWKDYNIVGY